ncbi:(Trans)glycosidase [Glarea lozoyensis ATCC 20868]|uniref:1,3-beta-glucanosyltransferase n=1 Tax=Glarea lozoyensis (strain ATCC 20868 / MF5171) TaxID=1116229 RepID=S3DHB8_GLAL2|nr:(Trans)glycosidase [Glarea lozoyensis ATCC 20868]EPE36554.1 (Trans)glycosidase [Glarea lozoyensis ATCC 20868]
MFNLLGRAAVVALAAISTVNAIPTISIKGSKFFADGKQFFLKGVAYQGTPDDPLVDTKQCQMDADKMKTIGTNSIRVYHINPWVSHDGCMKAFADAGIYIWLDLDTFNTSIKSTDPAWTEPQFIEFARVMDVMHQYDNLGGFWIGNEVIFTNANSNASPYVRAATADMKAYMALKKYRTIPIGYSAADIAELRPALQNYLACDPDPKNNIDFFGLNSYEWCGDSSYQTSGYANLQAMAKGYSIPIFFSETGCNQPANRLFTDQAAIFGPEMVDTWSGSIVYEWVEEVNKYGLVNYGPNGKIYGAAPIPIQPDFDNLAAQWKSATPAAIAESAYTPSLKAPACPSATGGWQVNGNIPMPTLAPEMITRLASNAVAAPPSGSPASASSPSSSTNGMLKPNSSPPSASSGFFVTSHPSGKPFPSANATSRVHSNHTRPRPTAAPSSGHNLTALFPNGTVVTSAKACPTCSYRTWSYKIGSTTVPVGLPIGTGATKACPTCTYRTWSYNISSPSAHPTGIFPISSNGSLVIPTPTPVIPVISSSGVAISFPPGDVPVVPTPPVGGPPVPPVTVPTSAAGGSPPSGAVSSPSVATPGSPNAGSATTPVGGSPPPPGAVPSPSGAPPGLPNAGSTTDANGNPIPTPPIVGGPPGAVPSQTNVDGSPAPVPSMVPGSESPPDGVPVVPTVVPIFTPPGVSPTPPAGDTPASPSVISPPYALNSTTSFSNTTAPPNTDLFSTVPSASPTLNSPPVTLTTSSYVPPAATSASGATGAGVTLATTTSTSSSASASPTKPQANLGNGHGSTAGSSSLAVGLLIAVAGWLL